MKPVNVTDSTFEQEVIKSSEPVLVDFWAAWCGPCKMIAPILEEMVPEYAGKLKIAKVDVDSNPVIATKYGIRSIPTLLVFKNGVVVDQIVGAMPKKMLTEKVNPHLN
ncbi:MAG: thioredoxin [Bacteroidetes bacterium]|nr:thioredoxin [Bacteroidota bacterium]